MSEYNPTIEERRAGAKAIEAALNQCGISVRYAIAGPSELFDVASVLLKSGFMAAHDAEKRAEWEGEQGETEWGMGYWTGRGALFVDEAVNEEDAHFRVEHSIVYDFVVSRQATPWLPIPDTASESREERSPAGDPAPHWAVISAGNIVIAQGYCWCNDPNGGYHQIGIKPAPVPDTTNHEIRRQS